MASAYGNEGAREPKHIVIVNCMTRVESRLDDLQIIIPRKRIQFIKMIK